MLIFRSMIVITAISLSLAISAGAQTGKSEYKFISTSKTSTFENELNAAAKEGYRLAKLAKTVLNSGVAGLVVREQEKPAAKGT